MKVKDLIEKLQKMPQEDKVLFASGDYSFEINQVFATTNPDNGRFIVYVTDEVAK